VDGVLACFPHDTVGRVSQDEVEGLARLPKEEVSHHSLRPRRKVQGFWVYLHPHETVRRPVGLPEGPEERGAGASGLQHPTPSGGLGQGDHEAHHLGRGLYATQAPLRESPAHRVRVKKRVHQLKYRPIESGRRDDIFLAQRSGARL